MRDRTAAKRLAGALVPMLCACASSPSSVAPWLLDPARHPSPDCPPEQYLTAVGVSADGHAAAQARARTEMVRRLGERIAIETQQVLEFVDRSGEVTASFEMREQVQERSEFAHAELIELRGTPASRGGEWYALACLDRSRTAAALERDLLPAIADFRSAADRAATSAKAGTSPQFTAAWREAWSAFARARPVLAQIRSVEGRPARQEAPLLKRWTRLADTAARIRSGLVGRIGVNGDETPLDLRRAVGEQFRLALSRLGFQTSVGGDGCADSGGTTYAIRVTVEPACGWGSFGHTCTPTIACFAVDCATGRVVFDSPIADPRLAGTDTRDRARALRSALGKLTPDLLAPVLRTALATEVPFDPPVINDADGRTP